MITHIKTTGFKGHDIDEPVAMKNIYIGPNGSGKSERAQAIALAVMGYVPWASKPKKKPSDIVEAYGNSHSITVAVTIKNIEFERKFFLGLDGKSSQKFRIAKRKSDKDEFARDLALHGNPTIFDLGAFMDLSDQKKIDTIFAYFPPQGNVDGLDGDIQSKTDELNQVNYKIGSIDGVVKRLTSSKSSIELPAGSLAEIRAEIESKTEEVKAAQAELKAEEIRLASEAAVKKSEADRAEAERVEAEKKIEKQVFEAVPVVDTFLEMTSPVFIPPGIIDVVGASNAIHNAINRNPDILKTDPNPRESIQLILSTLMSAGCDSCAAVLVAKRELSKYRSR